MIINKEFLIFHNLICLKNYENETLQKSFTVNLLISIIDLEGLGFIYDKIVLIA